jgi:hypothetical protein
MTTFYSFSDTFHYQVNEPFDVPLLIPVINILAEVHLTMASSGLQLSGKDAKINRLDMVFKKAIDVASNSLSNADLDDCFQDLKAQYGNVLPKLFVNMIAKTQVNIEVHASFYSCQFEAVDPRMFTQ